MNDKNDFDMSSEDDFYDEALDENFELDDDFDDFDLDADSDDSMVELDDDFDDGWEDEEVESSAPAKKSKFGLNFNTIVIAGAVVVGVFVVMSQVGKEKAAIEVEQPKEVTMKTALEMGGVFSGPGSIDKNKIVSEAEIVVENNIEKEDEGFLFDTESLNGSENNVEGTPPMPSPITSEELPDVVPSRQVVSDFLEDEEIKDQPVVAENTVLDNSQLPRAPDVVDIQIEKKADTLPEPIEETKIPDIQSDEDKVVEAPVDAISKVESVVESSVIDGSTSDVVTQKLDSIIQRLEGIETKIVELEGSSNEKISNLTADIERLKQQGSISVQPAKAPSAPKAVKKKVVKSVKKARAPKKVAKKVRWELRAAQPGKAWVSQRGQKSMRPVVVGDKLTGIGRIEAISYLNGRWVVRGSAGKIVQ